MIIQKNKAGELEIKTKQATVVVDQKITVNDVELEGTGEYEIGEVAVQGIDDYIYIFQVEEITLGLIDFKQKISKENLEKLSCCGALVVRLDGDVQEAVTQAGRIEPNVIIYAGAAKAAEKLKSNGVAVRESESIKLTKVDVESEQKPYFIEITNGADA